MSIIQSIGRRWRWGAGLAVATAVAVAIAGQGNAAPARAKPFSAVQLSDAVLFDNGPAAANLDSLQRGAVPWTDAMKKSQAAIDEAVAADPKWSASFAGRIQSGDPNQVQTALKDLGTLAYTTLTRQFGVSTVAQAVDTVSCMIDNKELVLDADRDFASYSGDVLWVDNDVAIYAEIAAAAVAVIFAVIVVEKQACPGAMPQERLAQDALVGAIATNMRTTAG